MHPPRLAEERKDPPMRRLIYLTLALACLTLQACITLPNFGMSGNRGTLNSEEIERAKHFWTAGEILMIPLSGMVDTGDMNASKGEPGMLVGLKDRLKAAEKNKLLKAIVLRIDSPGGTVTASDLIYREIKRFKEKMNSEGRSVPVVAEMIDTAASGGLYISMAADEIYAMPTTVTGSIGVIMMLPGLQGLVGKIGVDVRVIKSGNLKDIGSPWRPMSDEEHKLFQGLIDRYYQLFFGVILESRKGKGLTAEGLRAIADGRILDAETARNAKLIDGIKYPNEVFDRAKELAGEKDARVISYEYPANYRGNIYARQQAANPRMQGGAGGDVNLFKVDFGSLTGLTHGAHFMYLWMP
jgi:protease IV